MESEIQAVIFDNSWIPSLARRWLKNHHFKAMKRVHRTPNYIRYRITDPEQYESFVTKKIGVGIQLIIGFK